MHQHVKTALTACCTMWAASAAAAAPPSLEMAGPRVMAVAQAARLGAEIAVADQDGAIFDHAIGLADREADRPHRTGARWLWASVTKQVTAVLVMKQVEQGRISLDGTIASYLPGFAGPTGDTVTVRQLLQHTSGLPNPDDTAPGPGGVPGFYSETGAGIGDAARAAGFCGGARKAAPGAGFAYNNCDYLVLGAILERVTGKPYAALVARDIARPLGLRSLAMSRDGKPHTGLATGYVVGGKRYPAINAATFGAAGALTGTAHDLIMLDRALIAGTLLSAASRAVLWQGDQKLGYEALGAWSFAAQLAGCAAPVALVERRGDVGGIQVRNIIAPALGRSLVVFTNDDSVDFGEVWQGRGLSHDLLSAALCAPVKP